MHVSVLLLSASDFTPRGNARRALALTGRGPPCHLLWKTNSDQARLLLIAQEDSHLTSFLGDPLVEIRLVQGACKRARFLSY